MFPTQSPLYSSEVIFIIVFPLNSKCTSTTRSLTLKKSNLTYRILELTHPKLTTVLCHTSFSKTTTFSLPLSISCTSELIPFRLLSKSFPFPFFTFLKHLPLLSLLSHLFISHSMYPNSWQNSAKPSAPSETNHCTHREKNLSRERCICFSV